MARGSPVATQQRKPSGYRQIGNVYRFTHDIRTKGGVKFMDGELAVCHYSHGGLGLVTRDRRYIRGVSLKSVELVCEYDYTETNPSDYWGHVGEEVK